MKKKKQKKAECVLGEVGSTTAGAKIFPEHPKNIERVYAELHAEYNRQSKEFEAYSQNSQELACLTVVVIIGFVLLIGVLIGLH